MLPDIDSFHWITVGVSCLIVAIAVILHYEVLSRLHRFLDTTRMGDRPRILTLIFVLLCLRISPRSGCSV
ncbi:hypothetical protein ULF88_03535 [Halopseudomonas pachastrellae]|nr:hypothetical protein [Halopseudomonas pachastrellae]